MWARLQCQRVLFHDVRAQGSDPAMRLGSKTYSDRETIRDALSSIHEDGHVVFDIALEKVVSHLDNPANYAWTAATVTDFYMRSCFNVKGYEDHLLRVPSAGEAVTHNTDGGDEEQALWLSLCRALALRHTPLWLALLNGAVDRLVQLLIALDDETNAVSSFLSARYLARMLAYCSFEGVLLSCYSFPCFCLIRLFLLFWQYILVLLCLRTISLTHCCTAMQWHR